VVLGSGRGSLKLLRWMWMVEAFVRSVRCGFRGAGTVSHVFAILNIFGNGQMGLGSNGPQMGPGQTNGSARFFDTLSDCRHLFAARTSRLSDRSSGKLYGPAKKFCEKSGTRAFCRCNVNAVRVLHVPPQVGTCRNTLVAPSVANPLKHTI